MQHLDDVLTAYARTHLPALPLAYTWSFNEPLLLTTLGLSVVGNNWYEKTRSLKRATAAQWQAAGRPARVQIAEYAVRIFGGVKRNAPATLSGYVDTIATGPPPAGYKGIASWSKVAAFSRPATYAIFDARVSLALNAVQALGPVCPRCWWFPRLAGQNKLLKSTWPILEGQAVAPVWHRFAEVDVYPRYLDLLNVVALRLRVDIEDIEMLLFANAEILAAAVLHAHGNGGALNPGGQQARARGGIAPNP